MWNSPQYTGLSHVFELYLSQDKGAFQKLVSVVDITSYTLKDLQPDTNYKVKVRETNEIGVGIDSDTLVVATLAKGQVVNGGGQTTDNSDS